MSALLSFGKLVGACLLIAGVPVAIVKGIEALSDHVTEKMYGDSNIPADNGGMQNEEREGTNEDKL